MTGAGFIELDRVNPNVAVEAAERIAAGEADEAACPLNHGCRLRQALAGAREAAGAARRPAPG